MVTNMAQGLESSLMPMVWRFHGTTKQNTSREVARCPAHRRAFGCVAIGRSGLESTPKQWPCHLNMGMLGRRNRAHVTPEYLKSGAKCALGMRTIWSGIIRGLVQAIQWPFRCKHGGTATRLVNVRRVYRGRCDVIPGFAAHGWFGDPVLSGDRYPASAFRALPC